MQDLSIKEMSFRTGIHSDTISKYISMEEPKLSNIYVNIRFLDYEGYLLCVWDQEVYWWENKRIRKGI
ncbi:hypothetical protein A7W90_13150 [Clostridium sp. Bc-iso-3]|nr:hypothetical protein A7W90_18500 [Clostridium sp. Bc-iso-3]ODM27082.1 hypothetical protein A7W90_13150 [Clostridium sp. Bc-iso-3]